MIVEEIDIQTRLVATQTRRRLARQFACAALRRHQQGLPLSPKWKANWDNFIHRSAIRAINKHMASSD